MKLSIDNGKPGERLWVREAWADMTACYETPLEGESPLNVAFRADNSVWNVYGRAFYLEQLGQAGLYVDKWKPSIHMHRQSSRIDLEITNVRVERLQDISEADARAEGYEYSQLHAMHEEAAGMSLMTMPDDSRLWFRTLWDKINGKKHPGESNPWVWVIEFKRLTNGEL